MKNVPKPFSKKCIIPLRLIAAGLQKIYNNFK